MYQLNIKDNLADGQFFAMASPCQLLVDTSDVVQAATLLQLAAAETWRIEKKYSRYNPQSIISKINTANGKTVEVDAETARLIDFSVVLFELSQGMFDITSGALRKAWTFDGSANVPSQAALDKILPFIGWEKAHWQAPHLTLPQGMELDLGGIGKEYAVDQVYSLIEQHFTGAFLVNFGGDLRAKGPRLDQSCWQIGIESITHNPNQPITESNAPVKILPITTGAIATSGDSRRFLIKNGIRYSHILNPKTGWPIEDAARSITVEASTCTEAGMLASLGMLAGADCQSFLAAQSHTNSWIQH